MQVNIIPVNNELHLDYCYEIKNILEENKIRVKLDDRNEKLGYKMRESQTKKMPITLIIGDNEVNNKQISYRKFGNPETITMSTEKFVEKINDCIENKKYNI